MNKPIENDKMKRKRLKVISACGECRRKKTKCNGEYPCTGCLKARVECKYIINQRLGAPMSIIRERLNNNVHLITQPVRKKSPQAQSPQSTTSSIQTSTISMHQIQAIEERLSVIESILQNILDGQPKTSSHFPSLYSTSTLLDYSNRDIYPPLHVPNIQHGSLSREKRKREKEDEQGRDTFGLQLAPIKTIHHAASSGTPTIRNLLNDDERPQSNSAFHRLSPTFNETTLAAGDALS